jgi:O-6-methylguanine DNA methyltransferase
MTFKERALEVVRGIPKGQTMSYKEVAIAAGSPKASRVVGTLMRKNNDKTVPCHRVICSSGALGNFSGAGGRDGKKEILEREKKEASEKNDLR